MRKKKVLLSVTGIVQDAGMEDFSDEMRLVTTGELSGEPEQNAWRLRYCETQPDTASTDLAAKAADGKPADPAAAPKPAFDIAKFAGIFAAIGMAVGALGVALSSIFKGIFALTWWQVLLVVVAIMLIISAPACFIAWRKLRRRNLGPVLNANGWAVNSRALINILKTLTSVAKYPAVRGRDPYRPSVWRRVLCWLVALLLVAFGCLYFTNNLKWMGIERKPKVEAVEEAPEAVEEAAVEAAEAVEAAAEAAETPAE